MCNREYQEGDAKGADLVIAASNCREVNRRVYEECQKAHIPVNTADDRELCDFYFPSVVLTEDIVIGLNSIDHESEESERSEERLLKMCLIMNEITVPDNKIKKVLKHSVSRKTAGSFCIGDRLKCGSVRSVDVSVINVKDKRYKK